jgi:hypothetical protein
MTGERCPLDRSQKCSHQAQEKPQRGQTGVSDEQRLDNAPDWDDPKQGGQQYQQYEQFNDPAGAPRGRRCISPEP